MRIQNQGTPGQTKWISAVGPLTTRTRHNMYIEEQFEIYYDIEYVMYYVLTEWFLCSCLCRKIWDVFNSLHIPNQSHGSVLLVWTSTSLIESHSKTLEEIYRIATSTHFADIRSVILFFRRQFHFQLISKKTSVTIGNYDCVWHCASYIESQLKERYII